MYLERTTQPVLSLILARAREGEGRRQRERMLTVPNTKSPSRGGVGLLWLCCPWWDSGGLGLLNLGSFCVWNTTASFQPTGVSREEMRVKDVPRHLLL